jgi:hypothetical protein
VEPSGAGTVAVAVPLSPPGTIAVRVIATAVPTSSGEKGGVTVPLLVGGTEGIGKSQARAAIANIRKALRGRESLFIFTS